ncbi:hypothetical protein [Bacillus massilinigeriensis]|uniref:hypothetical protein n=1 Tax=Bacillus massilionigeriensis TaxID=1805475 RepID=UPI00096B248A|nr:hypothetical protein [Bacillus massilionigeriensis]
MLTDIIKYRLNGKTGIELEDWMKFSFFLAGYLKSSTLNLKLYLSVPSNLLFGYFTVLGAVDYDFRNPSKEIVYNQYTNLKKGQRILYKVNDRWGAFSVLRVVDSPINPHVKTIMVRDKQGSTRYIPENKWFDCVRIHDNDVTNIRNTRIVKDVESLEENNILNMLYSKQNLNLLSMKNTPNIYLCANKKEWQTYISSIELELFGKQLTLDELIYDGNKGHFRNILFLNNNHGIELPSDSTIIFIGTTRTLHKMDDFKHLKSMYIVDQHDSIEKREELQFKIEQDYLIGKSKSLNQDILNRIKEQKVSLPKGVELFAWESKS